VDERTQYELKKVVEQAEGLIESVARFGKGARYRRDPERIREFYQRLRQTRHYLECACDELEGRDSRSEQAEEPEKTGWFRSKMSDLTRNLISGLGSGENGESEGEAEEEDVESPLQGRRAGFHGDSWSISIPDILGLMQVQGKNGVLEVELESEVICIELNRGDLIHAYSKNPPPGGRLGEILVSRGILTQKRLDSFLFCFTGQRGLLGEALRSGEVVTEEQLRMALDYQVQQLFHRIFAAKNCTYSFIECSTDASKARRRRNITSLLLESARIADESSAKTEPQREPAGALPKSADASASADETPMARQAGPRKGNSAKARRPTPEDRRR
jgi:hypothetical protein